MTLTDESIPKLEEEVDEETVENLDELNAKRKRNNSTDSADDGDEAVKKLKPDEEEDNNYSSNGVSEYAQYGVHLAPTNNEGGSVTIEISPEKVGQVIGSKGAIIQEIQTRTGAKAFVNQDFPDGVNRQVNLTGTPEQVKAASDLIHLILDQGPQAIHINSMNGGAVITSIMECTQDQVGKVIGTKGATIKELQSKSGARIQIDQDFPPDVPRKINMTGTASAVALAAQLIQTVITSGAQAAGLGVGGGAGGFNPGFNAGAGHYGGGGGGAYGMYGAPQQQMMVPPVMGHYGGGGGPEAKNEMTVPKSIVGKIIGSGGETIKLIQRKSGARVQVDQAVPEGQPCRVQLHGTQQAIGIAQQLILEVMNGVPGARIGENLPNAPMTGASPYGMAPQMQQPQPYGMPAYGGMPMQMPPQQYGGYGGYPPQQQMGYQPQPQYGMPPVAAGGYQPYGAAAGGAVPGAYPAQSHGGPAAYAQPQPVVAAVPKAAPATVWTEHKTDDGITYWYNASTGVSQWERPKNM